MSTSIVTVKLGTFFAGCNCLYVTADYSGTVSRIALNKVRYVAIFEGVPLFPVIETPELDPEPTTDADEPEAAAPAIQFHWAYVLIPLGVIAAIGGGIGAALFIRKRRESYDGAEDSDDV